MVANSTARATALRARDPHPHAHAHATQSVACTGFGPHGTALPIRHKNATCRGELSHPARSVGVDPSGEVHWRVPVWVGLVVLDFFSMYLYM